MENQPKLNSSKEIVAFLAARFPQCFTLEGEAKPLKIGIFQDIFARIKDEAIISKTQLRSALRLYTSSWRYLYATKLAVQRVDLDGKACGALEAEHVAFAQKQLQESKARVKAQAKLRAAKRAMVVEPPADTEKTGVTLAPSSVTAAKTTPSKKKAAAYKKRTAGTTQRNTGQKERVHVAISDLKLGQQVKVKAGRDVMDATIQEISKDGIRVQLMSGMAVIVRAEHLLS